MKNSLFRSSPRHGAAVTFACLISASVSTTINAETKIREVQPWPEGEPTVLAIWGSDFGSTPEIRFGTYPHPLTEHNGPFADLCMNMAIAPAPPLFPGNFDCVVVDLPTDGSPAFGGGEPSVPSGDYLLSITAVVPGSCLAKPDSLTFEYYPQDCSASQNDQNDASCSGGVPGSPAQITAEGSNANWSASTNTVAVGDAVTFTGSNGNRWPNELEVTLDDGNTVQTFDLHTSCSQPLTVGDIYGSFLLTDMGAPTDSQVENDLYDLTIVTGTPGGPVEGPSGPTGPQGPSGPTGPQGPTGPAGATGAQGPKGDDGAAGPTGAQGPTGPAGATGAQGPKGDDGAAGPTGAQGPTGPAGATGAQGPKGDDGAAGPTGAQGPKGDDGAAGPTGAQGPKGDDGAAGPTGAQGPKGDDGAAGPAGPTGAQGPKGDDGAAGPAGPAGPTGAQGPKGDDGAAGPAGPTGAQGPKGDDGAAGPAGPTGAQGPKGNDGAAGPAGATGPQGPEGQVGPMGPPGQNGQDGKDGKDGDTGPMGPQGPSEVSICFADTRDVRINIKPGTIDEFEVKNVAADVIGRFYGIGDSAPNGNFLEVAVPNPHSDGWRVTRLVAKARGSDARWQGLVKLKTSPNAQSGTVNVPGASCNLSGSSGSSYDTCVAELSEPVPLDNLELMALLAKSTAGANDPVSELRRVSGCIILEPPAE